MNLQSLLSSLAIAGLLAACQVTGTTQDPDRADDAANPSSTTTPDPYTGNTATPTTRSASPAAPSTPAYTASEASSRTYDEPRTASTEHGTWGPGTMHISFGGSFVNDQTADEPSDPGDDIETLDVHATVGRLLTERVEINVQGNYHEADIGVDDVNRTGLFGGVRYYVAVPGSDLNVGVYGEGKAGILSVDSPARDDQEFAYGASAGALWWPWGIEHGMAFDISIDWLESDVVDRVGASGGMSFYW